MRLPTPPRVAVALVVAVLLAGCGGSSTTAGPRPSTDTLAPAAAVRAAAAATEAAGSSRFELTSRTEVGGQAFELSGTGVYDPATRTGSATFTLPGGVGTMEQRFLGDELFLTVPGQPGYYRLSVADLVGTQLETASDPTGSLEALESVSDDVEEVGQEDVRGEPTTRYRGTIDAAEQADRLGGALGELAGQGLDPAALQAAPFEAWIDDDGRLRRFVVTLELPASEATQGQSVTSATTMELFDFGVTVDVAAPPADQVQDGAPLLESLGG